MPTHHSTRRSYASAYEAAVYKAKSNLVDEATATPEQLRMHEFLWQQEKAAWVDLVNVCGGDRHEAEALYLEMRDARAKERELGTLMEQGRMELE